MYRIYSASQNKRNRVSLQLFALIILNLLYEMYMNGKIRFSSFIFDAQLNVHNSCMTELEQWTVVLPNFHLHAQNATLIEFFGLLPLSFRKTKFIT